MLLLYNFLHLFDPRSHFFEASPSDASTFSFSSFSFFFFISFRILFFSFLRFFFSFFSASSVFSSFSFVLSSSVSSFWSLHPLNRKKKRKRKQIPSVIVRKIFVSASFSYHNIVTDLLDRGCIKIIIARGHRKGSF